MFNDDTPITVSYLRRFIPLHASTALRETHKYIILRTVKYSLMEVFGADVRINKQTQANIIQAVKELKLRKILESK